MKQMLLKTGLLLFCYTLIISNHIEKSKYFMIINTKTSDFSDYHGNLTVPEKKHIPSETYYNYLSTYHTLLKNLVITNSSEKILPFENRNNLWLTIFFLISVTIIIVSIDINDKSIINKKVLLLSIPILFYFFQSFYTINPIPLTGNNSDTESNFSKMERDIDDLESNQSSLEDRISDLEY